MKKIKIIIGLVLILAIAVPITYLLLTEKMFVRFPALVLENPKITFVVGKAYYRKSVADEWAHAIVGTELHKNFEVKTEKNSIVDIRFHNSMAIRIIENSILKIDNLTVKKLYLNVEQGSLYGKFEKIFKNHSIKVKTPTAVASIRGTELGFEVFKIKEKNKDENKKNPDLDKKEKDKKVTDKDNNEEIKGATRIYAISGITEIYNPKVADQKILLSYQQKSVIKEDSQPGNPDKMTQKEVLKIRSILNSIHHDEVLLISDKITFGYGSAKIKASSYDELDKIAEILKKRDIKIRIEGHTDNQGDAASNQKLSVLRAQSICDYFIKKGIEKERLSVAGYGLSKPIASNKTAKGRSMNRRVEFIIVKKKSFFDFMK